MPAVIFAVSLLSPVIVLRQVSIVHASYITQFAKWISSSSHPLSSPFPNVITFSLISLCGEFLLLVHNFDTAASVMFACYFWLPKIPLSFSCYNDSITWFEYQQTPDLKNANPQEAQNLKQQWLFVPNSRSPFDCLWKHGRNFVIHSSRYA